MLGGEGGVTQMEAWREMGLSEAEHRRMVDLLGREPNLTETGMFAVLWSEHCAYKHSRHMLKTLPRRGRRVLVGPGENAGVVGLGRGLALAFRIESHNHPSAIEPHQGAATGIGGIVRDILAMGARPVALLDSLHFGPPGEARNRHLLSGVVGGIAAYGNCIGVPTVGGEIDFGPRYTDNPLVNVLCAGVVAKDRLMHARAARPGSALLLVGSYTGRDGIHGATFASAQLDEASQERRPAVQVGDPFLEKLLIEACLEMVATGKVEGLQDLRAAGLTSSLAETASRGGTGVRLDLDRVPLREEGMTSYEIMLSESQERMLAICRPEDAQELIGICRRWGLNADVIGETTDDRVLTVRQGGEIVAQVPVRALTEEVPGYYVAPRPPADLDERRRVPEDLPQPDATQSLLDLLSSPQLCCRRFVYEQYDYQVRTDTLMTPGGDAAVLRLRGTRKAVALATDSGGLASRVDPYRGAALAVAEAARNLAVVGAEPLGITNCLNFGDPDRPEVAWQFAESVDGMAEACRALGIPVTGGNVSFYNETEGVPVHPTVVVGMAGLVREPDRIPAVGFRREGDFLVLLGSPEGELGASVYLEVVHGLVAGQPPAVDYARERMVQGGCVALVRRGLLASAHDLSAGGLALAVAEGVLHAGAGAQGAVVNLPVPIGRVDGLLFGEAPSRILVSCSERHLVRVKNVLERWGVPQQVIGRVSAKDLTVRVGGKPVLSATTEQLRQAWEPALERMMSG